MKFSFATHVIILLIFISYLYIKVCLFNLSRILLLSVLNYLLRLIINKMSIIDLFLLSSTFVKILMLILISSSVWSWGFMFMKYISIRKTKLILRNLDEILIRSYSMKNFLNGLVSMREDFIIKLYTAISMFYEKRSSSKVDPIIESVFYNYSLKLRSGTDFLASVASISPYIGLLGTVWGIMSSFRSMIDDVSNISAIAPGIAESLLATAVGLVVAIPANLGYNSIATNLEKVENRFDIIVKRISNINSEKQFID